MYMAFLIWLATAWLALGTQVAFAYRAMWVQTSLPWVTKKSVFFWVCCTSCFLSRFSNASRPVADVGCWWMVSDDGALHGVVWYSCWTAYGKENASPLKRMLYFHWGFSGWLWLAPSWFVSVVAVHVIFPFVLYLGKNGGTQARRWRRRGERQHAYEQTKKKCHRRWQQPATCARKLAITSTRQQASMSDSRNIKNQVQKYWWILRQEPLDGDRLWATALDGYRHWAMALIGGSQTKEGEGRVQKPLFNNHSITAKESWHYPMCSFNFCWGCVGDTLARRMPYEMLVPRCKGILQCVNFHFIRALCAPSVSPCGSCGTVMDGHGHLHTVISKEFCWRAFARSMLMSHSAMGRHKLVCFFCLARCASFRCVL